MPSLSWPIWCNPRPVRCCATRPTSIFATVRWWPMRSASNAARKSSMFPSSKQRHLAFVNWRSLRRVDQTDDQPLVLEPVLVAHQKHQFLAAEVCLQLGPKRLLPIDAVALAALPEQSPSFPIHDLVLVLLLAVWRVAHVAVVEIEGHLAELLHLLALFSLRKQVALHMLL